MLGPLSHTQNRDPKVTKKAMAQQEGSEPMALSSTPTPLMNHVLYALLEPLQNLQARRGTMCARWSYRWESPRKNRENTRDSSKAGQLLKAEVLTGQDAPQNSAQETSAHTCSIQKFLIHTVGEAAEQAMCPHHTSLQFLSGDGLIRSPLFHFTAEGREATQRLQGASLKDARSLLDATAQPTKMAFHPLWLSAGQS